MASLNQCSFIGRLGKDPEMRYTPDGKAIASFSIACSESWKDKQTGEKKEKTEWINITAFGKLGEIVGEYLQKGSHVYISGKFTTDKYEKDGQTRYSSKIIAKDLVMLGGKTESNQQAQNASSSPDEPQGDEFNDDIPFAPYEFKSIIQVNYDKTST